MTTDQFYIALAKKTKRTKTRWELESHPDGEGGRHLLGMIRISGGISLHCPLSFVAGTDPCEIKLSAKKCGIRMTTANAIADAADGCGNATHRSRLLKACGLEAV